MLVLLRFFILGLCFHCQQSVAASRHNPDAHTHGVAQMTVLYETGQLLIELETPAANMLGFEHRPQNAAQWQRLSQLEKTLNAPDKIVGLHPDCKVQNVKVELPFNEREETKNASGQPTTENPTHAHRDNHSDGTHSHHDKTPYKTHQDIHLSYEWRCTGPTSPVIQLRLFSLYPSFEKIQAQWVANSKQGAIILNKSHVSLEIKP